VSHKLESYNKATRELLLLAEDYELPIVGKWSLPEIVKALRESFKYQLTYWKVFGEHQPSNCPASTGFCSAASYYIYLETGGANQWKFMQNPIHWWLEHNEYSGAFDVTYDQFPLLQFPSPVLPSMYRTGRKLESRIDTDKQWTKDLYEKAMILGKYAGLE